VYARLNRSEFQGLMLGIPFQGAWGKMYEFEKTNHIIGQSNA